MKLALITPVDERLDWRACERALAWADVLDDEAFEAESRGNSARALHVREWEKHARALAVQWENRRVVCALGSVMGGQA